MTSSPSRPTDPHAPDPASPNLDALLDEMTLAEQVSLLAGIDNWRTVPIARLDIPGLKVSDGPAGVRGGGPLVGGQKTAAFPVGIALGSSWNTELLREVGVALAREALDKGAGVLLAPTMNLFRSTLNGRNFESYSEDPFLTGKLGSAYVQGLQSGGVAATIKHFVGNESEHERNTISSEIPERALRELYLLPFEMTVKEGGAWAVMTAYNKVGGTYSSEHKGLIQDILRGEWGFDGLVMSDWGGTHSGGKSVRAGLDLEMPGPVRARLGLLEEAQADEATRAAVRAAARNVLRLTLRTGTFADRRDDRDASEKGDEHVETRALIRRAGAEGTVLLKNDGLLPLPAGAKVAVIGPNAATGQVMGGGSAQMSAHRKVSPYEGLLAALGAENVSTAVGCDNDRFLPTLDLPAEIEYFELGGDRISSETKRGSEQMWFTLPDGVPAHFRALLHLPLDVPADGEYELSLASAGLSRLNVDGRELIDNATGWQMGDTYFSLGSDEQRASIHLTAGTHRLTAEFQSLTEGFIPFHALRVGFRAPLPAGAFDDAVKAAAAADYAVVCIGTNGDWETEGVDRWGLELPGRQDELVRAVLAVNPRTVVLLQTGGPVLMPWASEVPAILQGWFPGQEAGHAFADVLTGHADPGGRLPQTFPVQLQDDPTHPETPDVQYPGVDGRVEYREGLYIGYRHVDRHGLRPLFPFGHGLSYSTFELGAAQVSSIDLQAGEPFNVTVPVRNTGSRPGQTVVQLYVHDAESRMDRPHKELKAFAKVSLAPGETQSVTLKLDMRSLAYFDDTRRAWVADAGEFQLLIGQSSANLQVSVSVRLVSEWAAEVGPAHS